LDIQTEIKWIQAALSESKHPTFIAAVKNRIESLRKVRSLLQKNGCWKISWCWRQKRTLRQVGHIPLTKPMKS